MEAQHHNELPALVQGESREAVWQAYRSGLIDPDEATALLLAQNMRERRGFLDDDAATYRTD